MQLTGPIFFVNKNPKTRGTKCWDRFAAYKCAKTVEEAIKMGMTKGDLKYDFGKGFCWFDETSAGPKAAPSNKRKRNDGDDDVAAGDDGDEVVLAGATRRSSRKSGKEETLRARVVQQVKGMSSDRITVTNRMTDLVCKIQAQYDKKFFFFKNIYFHSPTSDTVWSTPHLLLPRDVCRNIEKMKDDVMRVAKEKADEERVDHISRIWRDSMEPGLKRANASIENSKYHDAMAELLAMHWFMCDYHIKRVQYFTGVECVTKWYSEWTSTWITLLHQSDTALGLHTPNAPVDGRVCRDTLMEQLNIGSQYFHKRFLYAADEGDDEGDEGDVEGGDGGGEGKNAGDESDEGDDAGDEGDREGDDGDVEGGDGGGEGDDDDAHGEGDKGKNAGDESDEGNDAGDEGDEEQ